MMRIVDDCVLYMIVETNTLENSNLCVSVSICRMFMYHSTISFLSSRAAFWIFTNLAKEFVHQTPDIPSAPWLA